MNGRDFLVLAGFAVLVVFAGSVYAEIYDPDNYDSLGSLIAEGTPIVINTGSVGNSNSIPTITVNGQTYNGLWDIQTAEIDSETFTAHTALFCFNEIDIGTNVSFSISGTRALVLLAKGNISLRSNLHIGSAGASDFGVGNTDRQGTGGGYGGPGCWVYSSSSGWLVAGGRSYGDATLSSVLLGGSRGGDGNAGYAPGQGGGALALVSKYSMLIDATINANGYLTPTWFRGGGSGSGGAVLLHSHQLDFGTNGVVSAVGGSWNVGSLAPGTPGGSGRVALYYNEISGFDTGDVLLHQAGWNAPSFWHPSDTGEGTLYTNMFPADVDGDGMLDIWEQRIVDADPNDDIRSKDDVSATGDFDGDGLANSNEFALGTTAWLSDSDGDGFDDGWEVGNGQNPTNSSNIFSDYIQGNAGNFGLMTPEEVENMTPGSMVISVTNDLIRLMLQIQYSKDMNSWTNAGTPVIWEYPVDDEGQRFFRVITTEP